MKKDRIIHKWANTKNILSEKDYLRFSRLLMLYFIDALWECCFPIITYYGEAHELWLLIEDMIECLESKDFNKHYQNSLASCYKLESEDIKQTEEYKDFLKILHKLHKITIKKNISRLFWEKNWWNLPYDVSRLFGEKWGLPYEW